MTAITPHRLAVQGGYAGWRLQALQALAAGWPPEAVAWFDESLAPAAPAAQMSFDDGPPAQPGVAAGASVDNGTATADGPGHGVPGLRVSRALAGLLQDAALYRSAERWALLYRVLWRWQRGERDAASAADADGARLHAMAKSVRRAKHDMLAYVRFRRSAQGTVPEYLAWYEPDHDVLAYGAAHFARRMGGTSWWLGTPGGAALWDGRALAISHAPADASALRAAAADQIEPLWRIYYRSIFNPARLNEAALAQRMPVRFWKGLPEGPLIPAMVAEARSGARRVAQAGTVAGRRGKQVVLAAARAQPQRPAPTSLEQCRRCELWRHATQPVPGSGPAAARLMLVGEQPGDHEDLSGQAFAGPAGEVLDEALRRAGVARDAVYLTNAVKHFKWTARGKRRMHKAPAQQEVDACSHWLQQELAQVRPAAVVALGATALRALAGSGAELGEHMAVPVRLGEHWLLATWHPAHALRAQGATRETVVAAMAEAIARAWHMGAAAPG